MDSLFIKLPPKTKGEESKACPETFPMLATLHAFSTRKRGYFPTKSSSEGILDRTESENVPYWRKKKKNRAPTTVRALLSCR